VKNYLLLLVVLFAIGCEENATDSELDYNSTCIIAFYKGNDPDGNGQINFDYMCYPHSFQSLDACNLEKLRLEQENNAPSDGIGSYGAYFLTDSDCTEHCDIVVNTPQEDWIVEYYNIDKTCSKDN